LRTTTSATCSSARWARRLLLLQFNIEDDYRGRVLYLYLTFSAITPLGALLMGIMIDAWSAPSVIFAYCMLATLLMLAIIVRSPRMRAL
jgi:hypothetical protein